MNNSDVSLVANDKPSLISLSIILSLFLDCQLIFSDLRKNKPLRCLSSFVCVFTLTTYLCERDSDIYGGKNVMKYAVTRKYYAAAWHVHAVM